MFDKYFQPISFTVLVLTVLYTFHSQMPVFRANEKHRTDEFSTQRALTQLKQITKKPHFVGTKAHTEVREYLVEALRKMGLSVQIQKQEAVHPKWSNGTYTQNILARIKGTGNGNALLLLAHYDATPHASYGAADDGSGIVTLLESLRAFIASGKKPVNDIIILFSDAEELGLLGARAFVLHHPWHKDVKLVLNLEARGSGGPGYMLLETNQGNHRFIQAFHKANTPYPVSNSLMYSIYKMLPNDTDLTVFREEGDIDGFNFAFIDDFFDYHTAQDNFERLDRNTLKHQGSYIMALLQYFSQADLTRLKSQTDDVFFNFPVFGMIYYPFSVVLPLILFLSILFLGLLLWSIRKKRISIRKSLQGFIPLVAGTLAAVIIGVAGWKIILIIFPQYLDILHGFPYNGNRYIAFFISITLAVLFYIYGKFHRKINPADLLVAPVSIWMVINLFFALKLKGGGFFVLPLISLMISWIFLLFSKRNKAYGKGLFLWLTLPNIILFAPLLQMFPVGLGLKMIRVSLLLLSLLFFSLLPVINYYNSYKSFIRLWGLIGIIAFVSAAYQSGFSPDKRKPNSIIYYQDNDRNEAFFASYNHDNDAFTKQFLGENPDNGNLSLAFVSKFHTPVRKYKKTKNRNLLPDIIRKTVDDSTATNRKIWHYFIKPARKTHMLYIEARNAFSCDEIIINGETLFRENLKHFDKNQKIIAYYLTAEADSLHIDLKLPREQQARFTLYDIAFDLLENPSFNVKPRKSDMMPMPFVINDATIVKTNFE